MKYFKCKIQDENRKDEIIWQVMDDNYNYNGLVENDGSLAIGVSSYTVITETIPPDAVLNL